MSFYETVEQFHTEIIVAITTVILSSILLIIWRGMTKYFRKEPLQPTYSDALSAGDFGFPVEKYLIKRKDFEPMAKPCQEVKPCKGRKLNASVPVDSDPEEEVIEDHEDRSPLLKARQQAKRSNSQSPIENYKDSGKPRRSSESKLNGEPISPEMFAQQFPTVYKTASLRKATKLVEKNLTEDEKLTEAEIKQKQLESIFSLMKQQEEKFGVSSINDVQEQLKLYAL